MSNLNKSVGKVYACQPIYVMWMMLAFARAQGDRYTWSRVEMAYYDLYGESLWA